MDKTTRAVLGFVSMLLILAVAITGATIFDSLFRQDAPERPFITVSELGKEGVVVGEPVTHEDGAGVVKVKITRQGGKDLQSPYREFICLFDRHEDLKEGDAVRLTGYHLTYGDGMNLPVVYAVKITR